MASANTKQLVQSLMHQARQQFGLEYRKFFSNHLNHALISLHRIGASSERLQAFYDDYIKRLEPRNSRDATSVANAPTDLVITDDNWTQYIGQRSAHMAYNRYFDDLILNESSSSWQAAVNRFFPAMSGGVIGAATHGIIHLGMGIDWEDRETISEGLAYLASSYSPVSSKDEHNWTTAQTDSNARTPIAFLEQVVQRAIDSNASQKLAQDQERPDFVSSGLGAFQRRTRCFSLPELGYQHIVQGPILLPEQIDDEFIESLTLVVASAFLASEAEFFVLHGLTSWYSLTRILPLIHAEEHKQQAVADWLQAFAAVFVCQGLPKVDALAPLLQILSDPAQTAEHDLFKAQDSSQAMSEEDWRTRVFEPASQQDEEHIPKAAYMLHHFWQRMGQRKVFEEAGLYVGQLTEL